MTHDPTTSASGNAIRFIDLAGESTRLRFDWLETPAHPIRGELDPFDSLLACRSERPARIVVNLDRITDREIDFLDALERARGAAPVVLLVPRTTRVPDELLGRRATRILDKPLGPAALALALGETENSGTPDGRTVATAARPRVAPARPPGPANHARRASHSGSDAPAASGTVGPAVDSRGRPVGDDAPALARRIAFLQSATTKLGDLDALLALTLERAVAETRSVRGSVQFLDESGTELRVTKAVGPGATLLEELVRPADDGIAGAVLRQRRARRGPSEVPETDALPRRTREDLSGPWLSAPLEFGGKILGLLHVARAPDDDPYDDRDQHELEATVQAAAGFLRNALDLGEQERLALLDPLTELYNRRYFDRRFPRELRRAQRYGHPVTLLLLDIDDFKPYNDRHGYLAGDDVLRRVARVLRRTFRQVDVVCRWGGEEFAVLLPETGRIEGAGAPFADRLRAALRREGFPHAEGQPTGALTLSGGAAVYPDDGNDAGELLALANRALRRAKQEGKDRILNVPEA